MFVHRCLSCFLLSHKSCLQIFFTALNSPWLYPNSGDPLSGTIQATPQPHPHRRLNVVKPGSVSEISWNLSVREQDAQGKGTLPHMNRSRDSCYTTAGKQTFADSRFQEKSSENECATIHPPSAPCSGANPNKISASGWSFSVSFCG